MKDIVIHSWDELQKVIFEDVWDEKVMRYRNNFIYRGVSNTNEDLLPKLNRVCPHDLSLEESLMRNFKKYAYADLGQYQNFWQTLSLAQHHGLPTRLLDWTYSPLVAAHFATENLEEYDRDGCLWCVDFTVLHKLLPSPLKAMLDKSRSSSFTIEMLEDIGDFQTLKNLQKEPFVLFFEPASMLDRIANQYALFSLVSDSSVLLSDLLKDNDCYYRIIIPHEIKLEIRDKLDYINISERMIYPGLDGICKWISRRYSELGPKYNQNHRKP